MRPFAALLAVCVLAGAEAPRAAVDDEARPLPACSPPAGQAAWTVASSCELAGGLVAFDQIVVAAGAELRVVAGDKMATVIRVRLFLVAGRLTAGTASQPFTGDLEIELTGQSSDQRNASVAKFSPDPGLPMSKVLVVESGGSLSLHGVVKSPWLKLERTARAGGRTLVLASSPAGWTKGDEIVLPSTGSAGQNRSEVATILGVDGAIVTLSAPLLHDHVGDHGDARLNGEAGILSRNIRIIGDNADQQHVACLEALAGSFTDEMNMLRIRSLCYGGHTAFLRNSSVVVANIEMRRVGQATRIARYPIHWHLAADVSGSSITNISIHDSYQRCVTLHGTWSASVRGTVCYHTHGHAFYLEDGIEHNNSIIGNLAAKVRRGPMVCTDSQAGPSAFWITNPNNTFVSNLAVDVGDHSGGIGFWIISGGDIARESGPSFLSTDFWTAQYAAQHAGLVFNPSRTHFANDSSVDPWILNQQQGRTPLKHFQNNGVRSSHRGMHIDGFITASVPGEIGDNKHPPEDMTLFADPNDGTCNFFPAGHRAIPSVEGLHTYAPVQFDFDAAGKAWNFTAAYSTIDRMYISRCDDAWWSRAARLNITNALFAYNWIGMTNHQPGGNWCPHDGIRTIPVWPIISLALCSSGTAMMRSTTSCVSLATGWKTRLSHQLEFASTMAPSGSGTVDGST